MNDIDIVNARGADYLPGLLGIVFTDARVGSTRAELAVKKCHMAPNGFLHAGTVVTMADTCCWLWLHCQPAQGGHWIHDHRTEVESSRYGT